MYAPAFWNRVIRPSVLIWLLTTPPHLKYVDTLPCNLSLWACSADINVSQGSVATYARCGGIFNTHLTANLPGEFSEKKIFVNRLSFDRIVVVGPVFWPTLYEHNTRSGRRRRPIWDWWHCIRRSVRAVCRAGDYIAKAMNVALHSDRQWCDPSSGAPRTSLHLQTTSKHCPNLWRIAF